MTQNPLALVIGSILTATSALMLVPAIVDLADGSDDWFVFAASAAITGFFGVAVGLGGRFQGQPRLTIRRAFVLTLAAWTLIPAVSALPLTALGISYDDAFFESMSALTTTGSTVLTDLDRLPRGILLWRALLQWVGGIGIIVMAILLLPFLRIGGMQLFAIERSTTSDGAASTVISLVNTTAVIYVGLTAVCAFLFAVFGMSIFDAICHAMTAVATGGFSTHDLSFQYFDKPAIDWVGIVFMLAGALPFVAYVNMIAGRRGALFLNPEVRLLVAFLAVVSVSMAVWLTAEYGIAFSTAIRLAAFNVTSVVTTTGFMNADYTTWGAPAVGAFFFLTFVGGCTGSTSGAIKIYRFQIVIMMMSRHLKILSSPRRVLTLRYRGKEVGSTIIFSIVAFMTAFFASFAVASLALAMTGLDFVTAMSGAATALANVGPGLGDQIGPAGNFAALPDAAKWILSVAMLLGRLELLAVLVLLMPDFWR